MRKVVFLVLVAVFVFGSVRAEESLWGATLPNPIKMMGMTVPQLQTRCAGFEKGHIEPGIFYCYKTKGVVMDFRLKNEMVIHINYDFVGIIAASVKDILSDMKKYCPKISKTFAEGCNDSDHRPIVNLIGKGRYKWRVLAIMDDGQNPAKDENWKRARLEQIEIGSYLIED